MTIPKGVKAATRKVADMLQDFIPHLRNRLTPDEHSLGVHLRGNDALLDGLRSIIEQRIGRRASIPVPSDPLMCKAILERNSELRWFLNRLELIHRSPAAQSVQDHSEPPA